MYKAEIRHSTLCIPHKIDLCNLQFKRWGEPEIVAAIASHFKDDALWSKINGWESLITSVCRAGLGFRVSLQDWALDAVVLVSPEIPKLLLFSAEWCCHDLWEKSALGVCFAWLADKGLQPHFFNRKRLGGKLYAVLFERRTLQLNWE